MGEKPRRPLPFLVLAPALVVMVGVLAAFGITLLGLRELRLQGDDAAALRAELLSATLAARLASATPENRTLLVERARGRSGAEFVLLRVDGKVLLDATQGASSPSNYPTLLRLGEGEITTALGRARFHVSELPPTGSDVFLIAL